MRSEAAPSLAARSAGVCVAALGALLLLGMPGVGAEGLRSHYWAFDHLQDLALAPRIGLCAVLALACWPAAQRALARGAHALFALRGAGLALLGLAAFGLLLLFRQRNFALGDSAHLINYMAHQVHTQGWLVTYDEPLELFFHSVLYRAMHALSGRPVEDAYALASAAAGLLFLAACRQLARSGRQGDGAGLLGLLLLASPALQLFFGYVENYSIVAALSVFYLALGTRVLTGRLPLHWPALLLGLAASFHLLAGWLGLSLLYLWWAAPQGRSARSLATVFAAGALPLLSTVAAMTALGVPLASMGSTHLAGAKFIFLIDPASEIFVYPAFSAAHWLDIANQVALVSLPAVLMGAAALGLGGAAGRSRLAADPALRFLLASSLGLHLFAMTWNAEIGAYQDWDLFALTGLVDTVLGARMLSRALGREETWLAVAVPVLAFGWVMTGSFVVSNATREVVIPGRAAVHASAHLSLAEAAQQQGDFEAASRDYNEALRIAPKSRDVLFFSGLGVMQRDPALGSQRLESFLELEGQGERAAAARALLGRSRSGALRPGGQAP